MSRNAILLGLLGLFVGTGALAGLLAYGDFHNDFIALVSSGVGAASDSKTVR
jgi:hypothetical protein